MKTVSKNGARDNIPYQDLPLWNTGDNTLNQPNPTDNQLIPNSDNSNPGANSNEDIVAWATGPSLSPFGVPQNLSPAGYPFDQGLDFYNNYRCDAHMSICCSGNAVTSTNIKTKSCEQSMATLFPVLPCQLCRKLTSLCITIGKEVLGAGKEFLFWGDRRAATYCHAPIFMDHCEDVNVRTTLLAYLLSYDLMGRLSADPNE